MSWGLAHTSRVQILIIFGHKLDIEILRDRVQTSMTTIAKNKVLQKEAQKSVIKLWLQEEKKISCSFLI